MCPRPLETAESSPETQPTAPPAPALRAARASLPVTTTAWLGTHRLLFALKNVKLFGKSKVWERGGCPASLKHTSQGHWGRALPRGTFTIRWGGVEPCKGQRKEGRKDVHS